MKNLNSIFKLTLILFFVTQCFNLKAQVTVSESFDGTNFLPNGWTSIGTTNLWSRRTAGTFPTCTNHSGAGMVRYGARGVAAKTIQTIVSPIVNLSNRGSNKAKISLWLYRDNGSTLGDSLSVYINTTASLTSASILGTVARYSKLKMPDTVANNGWYQYTFNLPAAYKTNTNYFLFKGIGEAGYNIYIDDIEWDEFPNLCTGTPTAGSISASTSLICGGTGNSTLTLNGNSSGLSGLSFQWKSSSSASGPFVNFGTSATSINTGIITSTKFYKCVVSCSFSAKSDSTSVKSIVVSPNPNPIVTVNPNTANFCVGSNVPVALIATSASAIKFSWSPATGLDRTDSSTVFSMPNTNVNYTVTGLDALGCLGTANVTVSIRQPPFVTINSTDSTLCLGDSLRLNATVGGGGGGGNTYLWSPTNKTSNFIFAKPIINSKYSVTVKNTFGCTTTVSKKLFVAPKSKANFGYKTEGRKVYFYDSSSLSNTHEWDFGDGNGSKKQNPVYIFVDDGNYSVKLIISNAPCKPDTILKIVSIGFSGINFKTVSGIELFPNPVHNQLTVTRNNQFVSNIVIYNILGEKVIQKTINQDYQIIELDALKAGVYSVGIERNGLIYYTKLVKQ